MFYNMQGDTVFDSLYPGAKINGFYMFFWTYFPLIFGAYIFNKIALAMVEQGYIDQKYRR